MMQSELHEGIHYIFDRYAFLNKLMESAEHEERISPDSDKSSIERVIKLARVMYHPDRLLHVPPEFRAQAEQKLARVVDCETFLTNPDLKGIYDAKLAEFKADKPQVVSADGTPILDIMAPMFDVKSLLNDHELDTTTLEDHIGAMTQYNEAMTTKAKALYEKMPDDEDMKSLYREALTKKFTYLSLLEDVAWTKVGYFQRTSSFDGPLYNARDYAEKVEEAIQNSKKTDVIDAFSYDGSFIRIGMTPVAALLQDFSKATQDDGMENLPQNIPEGMVAEAIEKLRAIATENFEIRAEYVREVSKKKQETLSDLADLAITHTLHVEDESSPSYLLYVAQPGEDGIVLFSLNADVANLRISHDDVYDGTFTVSTLKAQSFDRNTILIERNPEIKDVMVEVSAVGERLAHEFEQKSAPAPQTISRDDAVGIALGMMDPPAP